MLSALALIGFLLLPVLSGLPDSSHLLCLSPECCWALLLVPGDPRFTAHTFPVALFHMDTLSDRACLISLTSLFLAQTDCQTRVAAGSLNCPPWVVHLVG